MIKRKIKLFGWSIGIGVIGLITIYFFLRSLNDLFGNYLSNNAFAILIISGIIILLLIIGGYMSIKRIWKKQKEWW